MLPKLQVTEKQAMILQQIIRGATSPQNLVLRAKIVLASRAYGRRNTQIGRELNCNPQTVATWRNRWVAEWVKCQERV